MCYWARLRGCDGGRLRGGVAAPVAVAAPAPLLLGLVVPGGPAAPVAGWPLALVVFALCALASVEGARLVGQPRLVRGRPSPDLLSGWLFAAALVLPAPAVVLAAAVLVPLLVRGRHVPVHRTVVNAAVLAVAGLAAHGTAIALTRGRLFPSVLQASEPGRLAVAGSAALVAYALVNAVLVALALRVTDPGTPARAAVGGVQSYLTDLAVLSLGLLTALAWSVWPPLMVAAVAPTVLLQRALVHDELRDAARTDAKTGLATSRYWLETAERHLERGRRAGTACAVLLLDVDHFKRVNDTWGHLAGDTVLANVAATLRASVRPADLVGRLGGEEFAVVLPGAVEVEAEAVAERLRGAVADRAVPVAAGGLDGVVQVTVSVGVAGSTPRSTVRDLLSAADAALYRAKAAGRDQVATAAGGLDVIPDQVRRQPFGDPDPEPGRSRSRAHW